MKYLLKYFVLTVVALSFFNCVVEPMEFLDGATNAVVEEIENSVLGEQANPVATDSSCDGQDPKARITNNGTVDVDLEIYDVDGNLIASEYGVEPGHHSDWEDFSSGEISFLVSNGSADKLVVIEMSTCMKFDMEIGSNNQLVSDQPEQL